jgi:hypothetical protein
MSLEEDRAGLFHHLMAEITACLEGAAALAAQNQAGTLPEDIAPLLARIAEAERLARAADTIARQKVTKS